MPNRNLKMKGQTMSIEANQMIPRFSTVPAYHSSLTRQKLDLACNTMEPVDMAISCYENEIPDFVESELERIYGNFYSSLVHLKVDGKLHEASTYIERIENSIVSLILFRREKNVVIVLNEVIAFSDQAIERFSQYIFHRFKDATVIQFRAIQTALKRFSYKFQRLNYLEDIVIDLPDSTENYLASLGKNLRRNLRRCQKKIERDFPSFSYAMSATDAINDQDIRDIVALNQARMLGKNKISAIDDDETARLIEGTKERGLVCAVTIDGQISAGAICFRTGDNYFLTVIAHDPKFDPYSLGMLCCALIICECIEQGGKEFHFLWGRYDYKYALTGVQRDLYLVAIYRSIPHFFANSRMAVRIWKNEKLRQLTLGLQRMKKQDDALSRFSVGLFEKIRRMKNKAA